MRSSIDCLDCADYRLNTALVMAAATEGADVSPCSPITVRMPEAASQLKRTA